MNVKDMLRQASDAAKQLITLSDQTIIGILKETAQVLRTHTEEVLAANRQDLERMDPANPKYDRLKLTEERLQGIAADMENVSTLPSPLNKVLSETTRPNGMVIRKVTVPFGVIGVIYEARPNVTSDAAALCLKAGSAVILRGGKEAINSNLAVSEIMRNAVESVGFPKDCIALVKDTSRQSATELMQLSDYLDVLIPRGGAGLIRSVVENAKVPVIETGVGNCHIYVDESADVQMAANIIFNAKTSRPSVCNAIETILVHKNIAQKALPEIKKLLDTKNVEIRGCETTRKILGDSVIPATEEDYAKEFLDYILAVKVVDSLDDAIDHIAKYSTGHSESIITNDYNNANKFTACVDSAAVYVNASTRFTDGGEFGLGAEIGISTQKLHARGPMGLNELTSCKFIIRGNGQIR